MPFNQGFDYNVDIIMCIDGTKSMAPIIDDVKASAMAFYARFVREMDTYGKSVQQLRVKVIVFRDYRRTKEPPMEESPFFVLDRDVQAFRAFVDGITPKGGCGSFANSLEAIALAMKSDWERGGTKRRHCIMVWTDAPAVSIGYRRDCAGYPTGLPADLTELHDWWEGQMMDAKAKRMLLFAPNESVWKKMWDWQGVFHMPSRAGMGCADTDIATAIHMLVNSI